MHLHRAARCPRSVQNRHQWKRYHHAKRLWGDALGEANLNEQLLWHGTSGLDPGVICKGLDGVDFRMVGARVSPVSRQRVSH